MTRDARRTGTLRTCGLPLGLVLLASCVPQREATPPVQPPPAPARPIPTPQPPAPSAEDWRDIPLTPGTWTYSPAAGAVFGTAGAAPLFTIRCDTATRRVLLARADAADAARMTIRTSFGERSFPEHGPNVAFAASDPFLDTIAFSRGRFSVETEGHALLVLPAWAEPARVIEDCRV